jgi:hypothetical protein
VAADADAERLALAPIVHARRGIRSASKLIESLDMAQGALELARGELREMKLRSGIGGAQVLLSRPYGRGILRST